MQLRSIDLKQFRCFKQLHLDFDKKIMLITGPNGSGKTSILEALHYLGSLRSFRSASPNNMVYCGRKSFFLKALIEDKLGQPTEIRAGFSEGKRVIRINKRQVKSYKELIDYYRVITITEDDLDIIKGGPGVRRTFLDQVILHKDPTFMQLFRKYRNTLENRNSLLKNGSDRLSLLHWTELLWQISDTIQKRRIETLSDLAAGTNILLKNHFDQSITINFFYKPKKFCNQNCFDDFLNDYGASLEDEKKYGRSLFGIHLDDISIEFQDRKSKIYASRGQQKLIVLLLKIAQLQELTALRGPYLLLLDDFMADFDRNRGTRFIEIINDIGSQAIFVSPMENGIFEQLLLDKGAQLLKLNI